MGHKNTVVCSQAFSDRDSGRIWAEIDIDFSENRMGPNGVPRSGNFKQGDIVLTSEVQDTVWGESGIISFVTRNSIYIVDSELYHPNLLAAHERGFPTDKINC